MRGEGDLPFKVGELVEARSFQTGFRGAWFRCKIREITKRQQRIVHLLEYYDFPDEKLKWMRLYQVSHYPMGKGKEKHRELMLRPHYPHIYNENQMPHVSEISEVTIIVNNSWKVGDLVDWWTTGCYWSGTIIKLLGDDQAQIELHPPPLGEGLSYEISLKDTRPSLDWSPEHGWTLPSQEGETGRPFAWLIKPSSEAVSEEGKSPRTTEMQKRSLGETVSKEVKDSTSRECGDSSKSMTTSEGVDLRSSSSDTLEAAVMDLEEYVNKVKWLKKILQHGVSSPDAEIPQWEYAEPNSASEIPK